MARTRKSVVLAKLAQDSRGELTAMTSELLGVKSDSEGGRSRDGHWSRRFAASGKAHDIDQGTFDGTFPTKP